MTGNSTLILHGVAVYPRPGAPAAEAIGIADGRVACTGTLEAVRAAMPSGTEERHVAGGAILPAFIDPHLHAWLVAIDPSTDALYRRASDVPGLIKVIAELAAGERSAAAAGSGGAAYGTSSGSAPASSGAWLRYHGYEPLFLAEYRSPTAPELDRAVPDRPLHVLSRTFHESVVNSAGLDALGIGRSTPDPVGGRIVRDRRGRATGVLLEASSFTAERVSRPPSAADPAAWAERLRAFGRRLLAQGITRIGDAAVPRDAAPALVSELAAMGIAAHPLLIGGRIDEPALVPGGTAKVLLDGGEYAHLCLTGRQFAALMRGSFRANMGPERTLARAVGMRAGFPHREPDRAWHTGIRFPTEAGFGDLLRRAADTGSGLAVHATGNGSVDALLAAREADAGMAAAVPVRVEHAMTVDPAMARRLAAGSLPVVGQPGFLDAFGHELAVAPLPDPLRLMPFRMLRDAGVPLAFSSDYPAADLSPWAGIAAAVSRLDRTGTAILLDEAVDPVAAFEAYGTVAARVLGVRDAGTLEPGMPADLIVCDRDPFAGPVSSLASTVVLATWSGGRQVYERPA